MMKRKWANCPVICPLIYLGLIGLAAPNAALSQDPVERLMQDNADGSLGGKYPTLFPEEEAAFFLDGEFLYMKADIDGLSYAWTFPEAFPAVPSDLSRRGPIPGGQNQDLKFRWDPGFRLAAGYRFSDTSWELSALWTFYQNHSKGTTSIPSLSNSTLIATWFPSAFFSNEYLALNASAHWTLNFKTVDLCLGRTAFSTRTIAIEPFLAFRGAFIHQRFNTAYTNGGFFNVLGTNPTAVTMKTKNDFDGWGIRPGVNSTWYVAKNISFYANGALSLLFGRYTINQRGSTASSPFQSLMTVHDSYYQNAFEIDCGAGLKWEKFANCYHIAFSVGYEMMSWFDQNQLFNYFFLDRLPGAGQPAQGDLGIQGLNGSVHFDF